MGILDTVKEIIENHDMLESQVYRSLEEKLPPGQWIIDFPIEYDHFEEESKKVQD